jgi:hypothetical protein
MPRGGKAKQRLTMHLTGQTDKFDNIRGQGYGLVEWSNGDNIQKTETPGSGELLGAPKANGALPLNF